MSSTLTLKLNNLSFSLLKVEKKDKRPYKHYGKQFYVEVTSLDRNSNLKKFIMEQCNIIERRDDVTLYIETDRAWGLGIYYNWNEYRTIEHTFDDVSIKNALYTTRVPAQSVIGLKINIICDIQPKVY